MWLDAEVVFGVVELEERGHVEFVGEDEEVDEFGEVEALADEEDGVGAGGAGFVDLVLVEDEVFAEDGECGGVFDALDVGEVSGEEAFVGEAGDGGGAGVLVGGGDGGGVEGVVL